MCGFSRVFFLLFLFGVFFLLLLFIGLLLFSACLVSIEGMVAYSQAAVREHRAGTSDGLSSGVNYSTRLRSPKRPACPLTHLATPAHASTSSNTSSLSSPVWRDGWNKYRHVPAIPLDLVDLPEQVLSEVGPQGRHAAPGRGEKNLGIYQSAITGLPQERRTWRCWASGRDSCCCCRRWVRYWS